MTIKELAESLDPEVQQHLTAISKDYAKKLPRKEKIAMRDGMALAYEVARTSQYKDEILGLMAGLTAELTKVL